MPIFATEYYCSKIVHIQEPKYYKPKNKVRIVTAASLFDGHDAAINIMRRIILGSGAEVIHLGHDRSVQDIIDCAIEEDAQVIALTSYQGGHIEFFKYMYDLLKERGANHIRIFGGGGGVILPEEVDELHEYGITRIYSPDDGRKMGLQGMINDLMEKADVPTGKDVGHNIEKIRKKDTLYISHLISAVENYPDEVMDFMEKVGAESAADKTPILGITGTGGSGKSSLVDEIVRRCLLDFPGKTLAIVSVDPSKRKTGGALLGDRIRMNSICSDLVYMRSLGTRQANFSLPKHVNNAVNILKCAGFDLIILETSGIGQSDSEIIDHSDVSMYVMTSEYGAATQLEKIDMLYFADIIALNKFDKRGAIDALRDVKKQYQRNHHLFDKDLSDMPVYGCIASQFNDPGTNELYEALMEKIEERTQSRFKSGIQLSDEMSEKIYIIPPMRVRYLSEISDTVRNYNEWTQQQAIIAQKLYSLHESVKMARELGHSDLAVGQQKIFDKLVMDLDPHNNKILQNWPQKLKSFKDPVYCYQVRGKEICVDTHTKSLSQLAIPRISLPKYTGWGDILRWNLRENVPGEFPYAAGVFPFKQEGEDPIRMFADEGGPEKTNKRFHYVSCDMDCQKAFDSF